MDKQHWEKEIEFKGKKYKLMKLNPFQFPAFKIAYGNAINNNDPDAIAKCYEVMVGWVRTEIVGEDSPIYSKESQTFIVDELNDPMVANELIDAVLMDLIMPLFTNTAE